MSRKIAVVLMGALGAAVLACSADSPGEPTTPTATPPDPIAPAIVGWLADNVVPFATPRPREDYSDLLPLAEMIGDARVVALGEATHGTAEFFFMKDRILRFLVQEIGFNIFGIEATWPEGNRINEYVHTGDGDLVELLSGLYFWTWNTEEVLAMIRWMRQYNELPTTVDPISFFGFDMQHPGMGIHNVERFLNKVDPEAAETARRRFDCIRPYVNGPSGAFPDVRYSSLTSEARDECRGNLEGVADLLSERREPYEAAASVEEFAQASQSMRVVLQYENMTSARVPSARDFHMAENALWLLEQGGPDAKIVLWAHNLHVWDAPTSMGGHLRELLGDDLVIVGFDFFEGSFSAVGGGSGTQTHRVGEPPPDTYEYHFHAAEVPMMMLDLRDVDLTTAATSWLAGPRRFRSFGCCVRADPALHLPRLRLTEAFDVLIYFERSTPSQLLPYRPPNAF